VDCGAKIVVLAGSARGGSVFLSLLVCMGGYGWPNFKFHV
jgi:hypothetical protein